MTPGPPPAHSWLLNHLGSPASTHSYTRPGPTIHVHALTTKAAQYPSHDRHLLGRSPEIQAGLRETRSESTHHLPSTYHEKHQLSHDTCPSLVSRRVQRPHAHITHIMHPTPANNAAIPSHALPQPPMEAKTRKHTTAPPRLLKDLGKPQSRGKKGRELQGLLFMYYYW